MKKVFINIFLTVLVFLQLNCSDNTAEINANQADLSTTPAPMAEADQAVNADLKAAETPLPDYPDADTALAEGNKFFDANENENAVDAYKQAVKLNPDLAEAYFKLGITYSLLENEPEATENPDETPTPTPTKKGKKDVPKLSKSDKAFENAVKVYKKIVAKNPKDDAAHYNLGLSYNKLDQDKEAEKALRQAVKLKPEDSQYQTDLGAILIKLAHYDEAVSALKKAVKLDESNLQAAELLETAEAGKKRIDYGVNKIVKEKPRINNNAQKQN
ncbi:hypothetical protein BH24ACI2_BH24ACI2_05810 [soil metagenome]|jgi:tetratricopeptide (TPR) repeat protein